MISFDTNLLLYSLNQDCPEYARFAAVLDTPTEIDCHQHGGILPHVARELVGWAWPDWSRNREPGEAKLK